MVQLGATALRGAQGSSAAVRDPKGGFQGSFKQSFLEILNKVLPSNIRMTRGNPHHHQGLSAQHGDKGVLEGPSMVPRDPRGLKGSVEDQQGFYLHPPRPAATRRKGVSWGPRVR